MSGRKSILLIVMFAFVMNVAGVSMSWARMAGMETEPTSMDGSAEHCAGHMNSDGAPSKQAPEQHPSCCDGGQCNCGCLPAAIFSLAFVPAVSQLPAPQAGVLASSVASKPFEDPLRPPIG